MSHRPSLVLVGAEGIFVLLSVVQSHHHLRCSQLVECSFVEYALRGVGFLSDVVFKEIHHIASSEVRFSFVIVFGDVQRYGVVAAQFGATFLFCY